jgi:hypothetical protein
MPRQFRLRSLFILTAIVAVGCWVGPWVWGKLGLIFPAPPLRLWFACCLLALGCSFGGVMAFGRKSGNQAAVFAFSALPLAVGFVGTFLGMMVAFKVEPGAAPIARFICPAMTLVGLAETLAIRWLLRQPRSPPAQETGTN